MSNNRDKTDVQYLNGLGIILKDGVKKNTRAGATLSVFHKDMRFDLKKDPPRFP